MQEKVLITKHLQDTNLLRLKSVMEIIMPEQGKEFNQVELKTHLREVTAVIAMRTRITAELINEANHLKLICSFGVGFDNIDLKAATVNNIAVANLPGLVTSATAEHTLALMLALSRRIVEADQYIRFANDHNWHPYLLLSHEIRNKKLGIFGLGNIGLEVARLAQAFQMEIFYHNRQRRNEIDFAHYLSKEELLKSCDYISLHLPLTAETENYISTKELELMRKDAYLINVSRGRVVDENALIDALKSKKIAGAALDVYRNEPIVSGELKKLSNVVLTPHIGSTTVETRGKMVKKVVDTIINYFAGKKVDNLVNNDGVESCQRF